MRFSRFTAGTLIITLHLVLPLTLILWTWSRNYTSITMWMVQTLVLISYIAFVFLLGSWVYASFYLRYSFVILTIITIIWTFTRVISLPLFGAAHFFGWAAYSVGLILSAVLIYFIVGAVHAHFFEEPPVNLSFPFNKGMYAIFEGGNGKRSSLMNYHFGASIHKGAHTNLSMRYAVDIAKVTLWGNDANGFLSMKNEKYAIFNQTVCSPCDGTVFEIEDKWPNEIPWSGTAPYNVGNYILITSNDFGVLMGHLQKESIMVKPGDKVKTGQPIAIAGNSGWTSQPHLHIQAMRQSTGSFWSWEGIPIFFNQKNPVKNRLFFQHA